MSLVIQQPKSNTNPSDKYRVVNYDDWMAYINGLTVVCSFVEFDTYEQARTIADKANKT